MTSTDEVFELVALDQETHVMFLLSSIEAFVGNRVHLRNGVYMQFDGDTIDLLKRSFCRFYFGR